MKTVFLAILATWVAYREVNSVGVCPPGYSYDGAWQGQCYKVDNTPKTWADAKASCEAEGASLNTAWGALGFTSGLAATADPTNAYDAAWMGATYTGANYGCQWGETGYRWLDNPTDQCFQNGLWATSEPNIQAPGACVGLGYSGSTSGKLVDYLCNSQRPFVCRKDELVCSCPSGYFFYEGVYFNACYKIPREANGYPKVKTWADAEADCVADGGHLVSYHTYDQWGSTYEELIVADYVNSTFQFPNNTNFAYWSGTHRFDPVDTTWTDGSPVDYVNAVEVHNCVAPPCCLVEGVLIYQATHFPRYIIHWVEEECNLDAAYVCKRQPDCV